MTPFDFEQFDADAAYEGVRESLNIEIARHTEALNGDELSPSEASAHQEAIQSLTEAQTRISPEDRNAVEVASLILQSYREVAQ